MTKIKCVGVVAHPKRPESHDLADKICTDLESRGVIVWRSLGWDDDSRATLADHTDVIVAIGGDGAMLRAARTCAPLKIPVLGVNIGYLGFLTEVHDPEHWSGYADQLMRDDYWVEERMMIHAVVERDGEIIASGNALNDVVITRNSPVGTVLLQTYIDRYWATTYHADALIIATATGSTGYGLAVGGPILPPELRNILILPVASHLSMDRPIVLSEGATVQVVISPERESDVSLVIDGIPTHEVLANDRILIQASDSTGRFIRTRERNYFYRSLLDRMEPRIPQRAAPEQLHIDPIDKA